jgi:hypothetical protein
VSNLLELLEKRASEGSSSPERAPEELTTASQSARTFAKSPLEWDARPPVGTSPDLERILSLPRRPQSEILGPGDVERLTAKYRRPGGTMTLRPVQAALVKEFETTGAAFGNVGVGEGKTIPSALAATVMGAKVAVLLVPPSLRAKFLELEYPVLAQHWKLPNVAGHPIFYPDTDALLHVVSYSQLSSPKGWDILERLKPDLIVADEAHCLARSSARTRRFRAFRKKHPGTRCVFLSGTLTNREIQEFASLLYYALGKGAPVPLHWPTLEAWGEVLNARNWVEGEPINPPGALTALCTLDGQDVRDAFRERLVSTPGVIVSSTTTIPNALVLYERPLDPPDVVTKALADLNATWETPKGELLNEAIERYRVAREISAGLYNRPVWPDDVPFEDRLEWLEARRDWNKAMVEVLRGDGVRGMDSPHLLAQAANRWHEGYEHEGQIIPPRSRSGPLPVFPAAPWPRWKDAKARIPAPSSEVVWLDDFLVDDAIRWGLDAPGVIWYEHSEIGYRIATGGKFPLYGGGPKASAEILRETGERTIVASIDAHGTGRTSRRSTARWSRPLRPVGRPGSSSWADTTATGSKRTRSSSTCTCTRPK